MAKIKDIPKVDRPREKFLKKGPDALSKSDLLAIVLGSGIKGKNVQQLSRQVIKKVGRNFLNIAVDDFRDVAGIGEAKALQIVSAVSLVKRLYAEDQTSEITIKNAQDVASPTYDLRAKKQEHLVCLYLNARNVLLKKEVVHRRLVDKTLSHPGKIFYPATQLNAAGVILVHNRPSGNASPSEKDTQVIDRITRAGEIIGIPVIDFVIVAQKGTHSFYERLTGPNKGIDYVADGTIQGTLFSLMETERPIYTVGKQETHKHYFQPQESKRGCFRLQNRRYLGNKYKLLGFIEDIISEKCGSVHSFCDIFAGTGVVGKRFNRPGIKIISNDFLSANYACLQAFLGVNRHLERRITEAINHLNNLSANQDNYFSEHFGGTYFTEENARAIGAIREEIERIAGSADENYILICSLIYAVDKVANTVGHYDAYRKKLDMLQPIKLLVPDIDYSYNISNEIYKEDANTLIKKISCDVLYVDPPYNSRQYSDAYHLLENLAEWKKPEVAGVGEKMDRSHIKSDYCLKSAARVFDDLISNADCKHILLSYNNTGDSRDERSNARMSDDEIIQILNDRGNVEIFKKDYRAFSAGKSNRENNAERVFYCKVRK